MPGYESTTQRIHEEQPGLCALIQDALPFYIENELSPEARAYVDAHVATCDRCASFLAGAQSVRGYVRRETAQRVVTRDQDWRAKQAIGRGRQQLLVYALACAFVLVAPVVACISGTYWAVRALPAAKLRATEPAMPVESYVAPTLIPALPTSTPIPNAMSVPAMPGVTPAVTLPTIVPPAMPEPTPTTEAEP